MRARNKGIIMRIRFRYSVAAGAVAVGVAAMLGAPTALADNSGQSCTAISNFATECASPGNVEINDSPRGVAADTAPWAYPGPYPVLYDEGSR